MAVEKLGKFGVGKSRVGESSDWSAALLGKFLERRIVLSNIG